MVQGFPLINFLSAARKVKLHKRNRTRIEDKEKVNSMAKPKNKKNAKGKRGGGPPGGGPPVNNQKARMREMNRQLEQGEKLWKDGDPYGALEILEDLLQKNPRNSHILFLSGVLYIEIGMVQEAIERMEEADKLDQDNPMILGSLALGYVLNNNPAHALMAYRQLRSTDEDGSLYGLEERERVKALEQLFQVEADTQQVTRVRMEQAMLMMERGELAVTRGESEQGMKYLEQAANQLPKWSPPRNNKATYLWRGGQAEEAIQSLRSVLEELDGENIHALSNLVQFLARAEQTKEAQSYMERLLQVFEKSAQAKPEAAGLEASIPLYYKTAEALAALQNHQTLYALLKSGEEVGLEYDQTFFRLLAASSWNLGQTEEAHQYWAKLEDEEKTPSDQGIQTALARPRPADAPAWRVPYFDSSDLVPPGVLVQMLILNEELGEFDSEMMQAAYQKFKPYYPFLEAELQALTIGPEMVIEATLAVLVAIATPEIRQMLMTFGLGLDGTEKARHMAISALISLGELPAEGEIRFWSEETAEWQNLALADFPPFPSDEEEDDGDDFEFEDGENEDSDDFATLKP